MLMQLAIIASPDYSKPDQDLQKKDSSLKPEPWTAYMLIQPLDVPVPTMWTDAERALLKGTSLESPVAAKLELLTREFKLIQERTRDLPFWRNLLQPKGDKDNSTQSSGIDVNGVTSTKTTSILTLRDWIRIDALFRSRSFDLPQSGESLVPLLDLANHSSSEAHKAIFQQDKSTRTVTLILWNDDYASVAPGEEVTISYSGAVPGGKPAAEMLFNYGFVDDDDGNRDGSGRRSLILPLVDLILEDDDCTKTMTEKGGGYQFLEDRLALFGNTNPTVEFEVLDDDGGSGDEGKVHWRAPFLYLFCVDGEDGFVTVDGSDVVQGVGNGKRLLWNDRDVSSMAGMMTVLLNARDPKLLLKVRMRAVELLTRAVKRQLDKVSSPTSIRGKDEDKGNVREEVAEAVSRLRDVEGGILRRALGSLEEERNQLRSKLEVSVVDGA